MMIIYYVEADTPKELNCSIWRCRNPARALASIGHITTVVGLEVFLRHQLWRTPECLRADIIVIERDLYGPTLAAIGYLREQGKVVVVDFDDALDLIPPTNPAYKFWRLGVIHDAKGNPVLRGGLPPLVEFGYGVRAASAATMPSKLLAQDWSNHTRTFYLPNFIDTESYLSALNETKARQPGDSLVIGWGGSASHVQSFAGSGILTALLHVCEQRPEVKVLICGDNERILNQLPVKNKALVPWSSLEDWPKTLAQFDIGLAPASGAFDDHRSDLKVKEYLTMGIPFVASKSLAYADLYLRDGAPVLYPAFVDNTVEAWETRIMDTIKFYDAMRAAAVELQPFALKQDLFVQAQTIASVYEEILNANHQPERD